MKTAPRERRLPLSSVEFRIPVTVPGIPAKVQRAVSGAPFPDHLHLDPSTAATMLCPQLYLDPELRAVVIGEALIPFDGAMVVSITRARAAKGPAA